MVTEPVDVAEVHLWDRQIGAVAWDAETELGTFEYDPEFLSSNIQVAPLTMPLGPGQFRFPALSKDTYHGLPGLLADSLPDRFGNLVVDAWLRQQERDRASFTPVEQLCYVGTRGMGALEFRPARHRRERSAPVDIDELADLAGEILRSRENIQVDLDEKGLTELLRVGSSAGGARAKAIIAWNPATEEVRSGQVAASPGFEYWILKFDGVGDSHRDLTHPEGYGRIEYAYYLMAVSAGIEMTRCRLLVDTSGRAHFMTRRFDRHDDGAKIHMQSLSAIDHMDFNRAGAYGYEEAMGVTRALGAGAGALAQFYRRMVFNVMARNQDDHPKNIAYLMDQDGRWSLAPAFDVTWAYNPQGPWTARHQMTVNGKRDGFDRSDLLAVADGFGIRGANDIIDETRAAVSRWPDFAGRAAVRPDQAERIGKAFRLEW
jgi:serine/threonine-protein kinase HipA